MHTTLLIALSLSMMAIAIIAMQWQTTKKMSAQLSLAIEQLTQQQNNTFNQFRIDALKDIQDSQVKTQAGITQVVNQTLDRQTHALNDKIQQLTLNTKLRLDDIAKCVDERLNSGFEKTTETFTQVIRRLTIIDEAQKKISELSSNVCDLQGILADKRSRGAFGEMQLEMMIKNMLPEAHFSMQHVLKNGKRADCMLILPNPSGNICIDAKFPLETYRHLTKPGITEIEKQRHAQQFRKDIKKHILDIASKYINPEETTDSAIMYIPAESVFGELHNHYTDLVELSHQHKVWITSPTTLMAVLTTARAVIKDEATKQQVHLIRDHLNHLGKDFMRFQKRMDNLSKHIAQAHEDTHLIQTSSKKITSRFEKIESVKLSSKMQIEEEIPA